MNNLPQLLQLQAAKSREIPDEFFNKQIEYRERDLAWGIYQLIKDGRKYSVEVVRVTDRLPSWEDIDKRVRITAHVDTVKELKMRTIWLPPKKIGIFERLKILFTGHIPNDIGNFSYWYE